MRKIKENHDGEGEGGVKSNSEGTTKLGCIIGPFVTTMFDPKICIKSK